MASVRKRTRKDGWPTSIATIGSVVFEQFSYGSMDACCSQCDWAQPWEGRAMIDHAASHGQQVDCINCGVASLNLGLPARCTEHGGPERCPRCQAHGRCYAGCDG